MFGENDASVNRKVSAVFAAGMTPIACIGETLDQRERNETFDVLDQHAVAMLERLATLPPLPEALEASEIQGVVPINYKLRKTT